MKLRVILVCTLFLLAAVPSFAAPQCEECNYWSNQCEVVSGAIECCGYDEFGCYTYYGYCIPPRAAETTVLTDWKVSSIEISRPALDSITVTAPAVMAEAATSRIVEQK